MKTGKVFQAEAESVFQYVLESEAEDFEQQCEERGPENCFEHVYAKAERALQLMQDLVMVAVDEQADAQSIDDRRLIKAESFYRERILTTFEVERAQGFQLGQDEAVNFINVKTDGAGYKKSLVIKFVKDSAEIASVEFLGTFLKI